MKRTILYPLLVFNLFLFSSIHSFASESDSIQLSLLTCAPGEEIYSLFGHTAIRYENPSREIDVVFNYGLFSFNTPNFIFRFALGETDYQLGVTDYNHFATEYFFSDRKVWQQTLNLTNEEKNKLIQLLEQNYRPENRIYRYNFFYDNCATRPRDKIEDCIEGKIAYPNISPEGSKSFRDIVHQYCKGHPWARFGIDLCIGSEADKAITQRQMMFAPFYLMSAFQNAKIENKLSKHPLVVQKKLIVEAPSKENKDVCAPTPLQCSLILLILIVIATIYGILKNKELWGVDLILFGSAGIAGCVLAFLSLFSEHPAVNSNYLLFIFHPGQILCLPYIIYCIRKRTKCWYLILNALILTLFIGLSPLIPQRFDFAVVPLALCLLIRSVNNLLLNYRNR